MPQHPPHLLWLPITGTTVVIKGTTDDGHCCEPLMANHCIVYVVKLLNARYDTVECTSFMFSLCLPSIVGQASGTQGTQGVYLREAPGALHAFCLQSASLSRQQPLISLSCCNSCLAAEPLGVPHFTLELFVIDLQETCTNLCGH